MADTPKEPEYADLKNVPTGIAATEFGQSGLPGALPGEGWIYDEVIPELSGISGRKVLRQLAEEPVIWASLFAIEQLVKNVAWRVEPSERVGTSKGEQGAEFVRTVLFEDLDVPFSNVVEDALSMLVYGFSLQEIVFKQRRGAKSDPIQSSDFDDGYWGVARLAPRLQDTIWRWVYDPRGADRLMGVEQQPIASSLVTIPYWKMLHFRTSSARTNPEGRPVTRGAYVPWKRKQELERSEGRMMSRAAGFVEMKIPAEFLSARRTPEQIMVAQAYQAAADRIASERQGSIVLPSTRDDKGNLLYEVNYKTTDSRRASEIAAAIERYDRRIAMTMLTDFILIGHESVGSFALSSSKTSIFARSIGSILTNIADQFNRVLLPILWSLNGFDPTGIPQLVPGDLEERDLAEMGAFLTSLAGAGMPLFPDEATENALRELGGLPARSESSHAQATATPGEPAQGSDAKAAQDKAKTQTETRTETKTETKTKTQIAAAKDDDDEDDE